MSKVPYTKKEHVYYDVAWSVLENGERKWIKRASFSSTPDKAFEETRETILLSNREDFEMRLVGVRFL